MCFLCTTKQRTCDYTLMFPSIFVHQLEPGGDCHNDCAQSKCAENTDYISAAVDLGFTFAQKNQKKLME